MSSSPVDYISYETALKELIDEQNYKKAYEISKSTEKPLVARLFADQLFSTQKYLEAAKIYVESDYSFEYITLRFLDLEDKQPLLKFLLKFLQFLESPDKQSMVASWILEILLSEMDKSLHSDGGEEHWKTQLYDHLKSPHLHHQIVHSLLKQHGQEDLLLYYADHHNQWNTVIKIYLKRQDWKSALHTIGSQSDPHLYYKYCPELITNYPKDTISLWTRCNFLKPRLLIPAMLRCTIDNFNYLIAYLEQAIENGNQDKAVHNYLLQLYCQSHLDQKVQKITAFLDSNSNPPYFDTNHALRLFLHHQLVVPAVKMYLIMKMHEQAVIYALQQNNIELALGVVHKLDDNFETDEGQKKTLWLKIITHTLQTSGSTSQAMSFAKEGGLRIEEILKLLPEFTTIKEVKEYLVSSLTEYNDHLKLLSTELEQSANASSNIRADTSKLKSRYMVVAVNRECDLCNRKLMTRQFHAFQCSHCFHSDCLADTLMKYSIKAVKLKALRNTLLAVRGNKEQENQVRKDLEAFIAETCVYCGELMIKDVSLSLVEDPNTL